MSIQLTLAAIADWHRSRGIDHSLLQWDNVKAVAKKIQQHDIQADLHQPLPKAGMTPALLGLLLSHTHHLCQQEQTSFCQVYLRDEIAFLMGFYGLLRRSEIIALKLSDVTLVDESEAGAYIKLRIRKSKTDQQASGAEVIVADISRHGVDIMERLSRWVGLRHADHGLESPLVPA